MYDDGGRSFAAIDWVVAGEWGAALCFVAGGGVSGEVEGVGSSFAGGGGGVISLRVGRMGLRSGRGWGLRN